MDYCCFNKSLCHRWFFTPSSTQLLFTACVFLISMSGIQVGYTNIEETIQYSSFCNLVFINEICPVS